ncbi:MAG: hypothetical protein IT537_04770 [Hyphomicrobiales bacterium]|nr:hypothetical protein [Hyphomicrobiales bacterium]
MPDCRAAACLADGARAAIRSALEPAAIALAVLMLATLAFVPPVRADKCKLSERLTPDVMAVVLPGAERLGPEEGSPPAIAVYKGGKVAAYVFSTLATCSGCAISTNIAAACRTGRR